MKLPTTVDSILIRCPNWIGDAVMSSFFFSDVKRIFPNAMVTALAHDPIAELLQDVDGIDRWITFSREKKRRAEEEKRVLSFLKSQRFDLGILLTHSFSSAWMFWRANIPWRLGLKAHFRSFLLNIRIAPSHEQHDVLSYQNLLSPFGVSLPQPVLQIAVRPEELMAMQQSLQQIGIQQDQHVVIVNPGAAFGLAKCWPQEYFQRLCELLQRNPETVLIGIGDAKGRQTVETIFQKFPRCHNLAGKTSIRELVALISLSDLVISNDSGPMHIAAAVRKPLIALFGSTNPLRTGPWGQATVIQKKVPCSPCYLRECPKNFCCMKSITPDEVFMHAQQMLSL